MTCNVSDATMQRVVDHLVEEADLDGLVTYSQSEISERLGVGQSSVSRALRNAERLGMIHVIARGGAVGNSPGVYLPGEAQIAEHLL